ncbi:MAG: hypothetical protein M3Q49_06185 [Actinomycetota bacterium]|nr:hypothetical protein [Actinomycetota bacterium]
MIREHSSDPAAPSVEEAIRAASLADLAWGPMDGKEAAAFLKTTRAGFDRLAPSLPRKKKKGLGFRYLRSELLEWLSSDDAAEEPPGRQRRQPDGNAGSVGVGGDQKRRKNGGTVRLI